MQDGVGDGWLVALTALVTALGAAGLAIYNAWHKAHQERDMTAVANLQAIVDRQEAQIARLCRHQREQQAVIARLQELEVECREVAAEQRGWMILLHDTARRFHTALAGANIKADPVPDLPPERPRQGHQATSDFLVRTEAQNSRLVQELDPTGPNRFPGPKPVPPPLPPLPPDEGGEP
jgi:hypothetical protein